MKTILSFLIGTLVSLQSFAEVPSVQGTDRINAIQDTIVEDIERENEIIEDIIITKKLLKKIRFSTSASLQNMALKIFLINTNTILHYRIHHR